MYLDLLRSVSLGVPQWVENLLLGRLTRNQYRAWLLTLVGLLFLVPGVDYTVGRNAIHLNLYPFPVMLSIFLFGNIGLMSVLVLLVLYHLVQVRLGLEPTAVLVNNLTQLGLTLVVGLLCRWLVDAYRALYEGEAALAQSRHELLMNLTHELRSPLFAIRGIVRNLSRNIGRLEEDEVQDQLNEAQAAIASINRDVEGLSQVFRVDLQALEPRMLQVPVSHLLDAVLKRHPEDFHPAHRIEVEVPEGLSVYCDPLLTQQSLDNLISNSIRHTDGGVISVSAHEQGDEIKISIKDEGPGVPETDKERIFARYDRGSRLSGAGFGVGLYLVDIYCKAQNGKVMLEEVPSGACFSIVLGKVSHD